MSHAKQLRRSTAFSLSLHAVVLAAISWVPLRATDRFSTAGSRRVVAIEMRQASPAATAMPTTLTQESEMAAETESATIDPRRLPDQRPAVRRPAVLKSLAPPDVPPQSAVRVPPRAAPPRDSPEVRETARTRPRRSVSRTSVPAASRVPVEQRAGISETAADFSSNPPPKYPQAALAAGVEGTVLLKLHVDRHGAVVRVEVLRSSGHRRLDQAAIEAVEQWTGRPATRYGRPHATVEVLPIRFRL